MLDRRAFLAGIASVAVVPVAVDARSRPAVLRRTVIF
jgi:hypothetical protein